MRWLTLVLLGSLFVLVQTTVLPRFDVWGIRPDLVLVLVVFLGMHARMPDAAVGAWVLGMMADLMSVERPGLMAMSYMLVSIMVASSREYFFRYRSLTQIFVTWAACFVVQAAWMAYRHVLYAGGVSWWADLFTFVVPCALYTGLFAPPVHKMLLPLSKALGIERPRYSYAGLDRASGRH
ncbi:MAG: rod shape-determining protein MreD, partial [Planctomycetes bacterium]|nr:rod shape-determining protein MreD [Planctomycetota bacterium]